MSELNTDAIASCNRLIQTCQDGSNGYLTAAKHVNSEDLKELFMELHEEREFMVTDLEGEITSLGGEPNEGGSIAGAFHRGWLNIKSAVAGNDDHEIIEEVEKGEDAAVRSYQEALSQTLPPLTRELLERHYAKVQDAHRRIRALELATQ